MKVPSNVDVVIIGGGIIGVATAYYLAKAGVSVAVCEKAEIACEQSGRNWGFVRQQGRDASEVPMVRKSLELWQGLASEIGEDVGFRQGGICYLTEDNEKIAEYEAAMALSKSHDIDTRLLTPAEITKVLPAAKGNWKAGLYTPSDGQAEPGMATQALARVVRKLGGHVLENCAVRGVETHAGRISAVVTEHGPITCNAAVLAGGTWSSMFCANLGIRLPQLGVRESVFRTNPLPAVWSGGFWSGDIAIRRRIDGGFTVADGSTVEHQIVPDSFRYFRHFVPQLRNKTMKTNLRMGTEFLRQLAAPRKWALDEVSLFEKRRVMDPPADKPKIAMIARNLKRIFPDLRDVEIEESWAGQIDVTPDAIPVICPIETIPGFYLSTGFSGHGFGLGPGAGLATAEMVMGNATSVDISAFKLSRFGG
ncbi:MAG: FAD-binding oxidoreductase [Paracoccaceae bacterium]